MATAAGVLMAFNPLLGLATVLTWAIVAAFSRYASLASLAAAFFAPFYQLLIWDADGTSVAIILISLLLVWRHEANIRKLHSRHRVAARPEGARRPQRRTQHKGHHG